MTHDYDITEYIDDGILRPYEEEVKNPEDMAEDDSDEEDNDEEYYVPNADLANDDEYYPVRSPQEEAMTHSEYVEYLRGQRIAANGDEDVDNLRPL